MEEEAGGKRRKRSSSTSQRENGSNWSLIIRPMSFIKTQELMCKKKSSLQSYIVRSYTQFAFVNQGGYFL